MLTARNIHKMLAQKQVLANVNASIAPGQITALIGPSGGGKSTFLRTLSFLDPPDSGTIEVDDVTYTFPNKNGNRPFPWPKVTIVFQQLFLWPHLTIRQNISLPGKNSNGHRSGRIVDDLIALFDLGEFAGRYPNQVSLGQRQRAAIARALALEPKYLLLDEITSALDVEHVGRLLNHIKTLRAKGAGILLVTHLIGFAERAADQILFMESGAIVEAGGRELLSAPKSKRLTEFLSLVGTVG